VGTAEGSGVDRAAVSTAWGITGARGQLGRDLLAALAERGEASVTAWGRAEMDLTDEAAVRGAVRRWLAEAAERGQRTVLINAGAYTAVDAAETDEATALRVNGAAPGWLAEELAGRGRLVHVSTDYVFAGTAQRPYREDDEPGPRTAYGRTKLAGERAVAAAGGDAVVVRTAWVYAAHGTNFVRTMLRLTQGDEPIRVVDDQTGTPTWARDLAEGLLELAGRDVGGLLHATNAGSTTWWGLARLVFELAGADPERVRPVTSAEFPRPAPRPAYSVLDTSGWLSAGLAPLPAWERSVRRCMALLTREQAAQAPRSSA
jgi:dTDP-4-dehydrorhamnose reductase